MNSSENKISDDKIGSEKKNKPKGQSFILSVLINLALITILAGPWLWASFAASHVDTPWHYIKITFESVFHREKANLNALRSD